MYEQYLNSGTEGDCDDMACCEPEPVLKRINEDTGRPQVSYDGGETWQPDPDDPQYAVMQLPSIVTGDTTKCDAASNALQHFTDVVNWSSSNIATAGTVYALGVAVATVLIEIMLLVVTGGASLVLVPTIAAMLMGVGTQVFELGQEGFDAYWDSDAFDIVLCALYCNIGEDGKFTEDQYQSWRTQVNSELPSSPARDFVMTTVNAGGAAGLSNMASYGGAADSDCSECPCAPCEMVLLGPPGAPVFEDLGDNTYRATSFIDGGSHVVYVWFNNFTGSYNVDLCGKIISRTIVSGAIDDIGGINLCTTGIYVENGDPSINCCCQVFLNSNEPFVVDLVGDCC